MGQRNKDYVNPFAALSTENLHKAFGAESERLVVLDNLCKRGAEAALDADARKAFDEECAKLRNDAQGKLTDIRAELRRRAGTAPPNSA